MIQTYHFHRRGAFQWTNVVSVAASFLGQFNTLRRILGPASDTGSPALGTDDAIVFRLVHARWFEALSTGNLVLHSGMVGIWPEVAATLPIADSFGSQINKVSVGALQDVVLDVVGVGAAVRELELYPFDFSAAEAMGLVGKNLSAFTEGTVSNADGVNAHNLSMSLTVIWETYTRKRGA